VRRSQAFVAEACTTKAKVNDTNGCASKVVTIKPAHPVSSVPGVDSLTGSAGRYLVTSPPALIYEISVEISLTLTSGKALDCGK
jgi:hypothetical protein